MRKRYEPKDVQAIIDELNGASDRAAISVMAATLESVLERAIESHLRYGAGEKEKAVLFAEGGLFGSFSQKIWAAYFLNIIGPQRRRDLNLIRLIRNQVSHDMNPVSFETSEIANRCKELDDLPSTKSDEPSTLPRSLRERFMRTAAALMGALMLRALQVPMDHEVDPGFGTG
jgi:hypothetical protein